MVHRSGSTHQYDELFANEESNSKAKDDLQISEALKNCTNSSSGDGGGCSGCGSSSTTQKSVANQFDENGTKRQLRTSKRLCSINPDVMTPPKFIETTTTNTTSSSNSTSSNNNNNNSGRNSNISSCSTSNSSNNSSKTSPTDPLITAFTAANFIPIATIKPKSIRNRRYTINDCVHRPSEKSIAVPFANQKSKQLLKISSTTDELYIAPNPSTKPCASGKSLDDFNIKKDHFNCSVSLERLTGIVDSISMKLPLSMGDKDDANTANKVLCLYCDRTFSSLKLYAKHVERLHQSKSGRRISARTIVSNATATNYPGCSYCNVGKVTCLKSEELTQLVHHLVQQHGDKYFACKECLIRFQTRDQLQKHSSMLHGYNDAQTKKKSQQKQQRKTSQNTDKHRGILSSSSSISSASSSTSSSSSSSSSLITSSGTRAMVTPLMVQVDFDSAETSDQTNLRNRLRRSTDLKAKSGRSTRKQLLTSEETFLSRLGIGLNRSPRSRKGAKNRRGCSSELFETTRSTRSNKNAKQLIPSSYDSSELTAKQTSNKIEPIGYAFDEDFYESVCQNVKLNLSYHLDGKLDSGPMSPSPLIPVANVSAVRSILVKSPFVAESEIHEATTISAFTAFPTLLTAQQHGGESLTPGKIKKPITKNSWKWKWDCVKKYKYVNEGGKIVKKIKQSTCGMRDLSTLDMWTQLTMRMRHEVATRQDDENTGEESISRIGEAARAEKRKLIDQLNKILDTRILPKINVEQNDQSIIKQEAIEELRCGSYKTATTSTITMLQRSIAEPQRDPEFPALMNLIKREHAVAPEIPVILSGEWARPRCYICFGCGSLFSTVRSLEEHKAIKHPFVHSTHYEIVGKELIDGNLFRNFYIPSLALQRHNEYNKNQFYNNICSAEDSMDSMTSTSMSLTKSDSFDLDSNSRNSKVSVSSVASISDRSYSASADDENANSSSERTLAINKMCSKCNRQCKGTLDLYRHILDCSSDYAWILAKKRNNIKYRYFGTKRRRPQRSRSSSARKIARPKKERRNSDTSASPKSKEPSTPRQRPSDAESIQRMLANLPAKRAARQIFPNLTQKPNSKNKILLPNRTKILLKQKMTKTNARGFKVVSTSSTTINSVGTNLALRKRRSVETANAVVRRTRSSLNGVAMNEKPTKSNESSQRRKLAETTATSSSTISSSSLSSSSASSSTGKSTNEPNNKIINDLGRVFRRRTKTVVTKITNTFRRGQKQRLLRTTTHHSPNTSKNTNSTKLDTNQLKTKTSKKTFLRTISFRRSNRNIKKMDSQETVQSAENESKPSPPPSTSKSASNSMLSDGGENKIPKFRTEGNKFEEITAEVIPMCNTNNKNENSPGNPIERTNAKPEMVERATESVQESEEVSKTPETPLLKRKRSIKTIINEMRAKCQNKKTETSQTSMASDLSSTNENVKKDDTRQQLKVIPLIEIETIEPIPEKLESHISIPSTSTHVTMPLSLTIEPLDEPLNLCISLQKNLSAANASLKDADGKASASILQSPEPHLENISPRRRTRKLNDCIAMLTGKLQEKLGVPFIDQTSALLPILSPDSEHKKPLAQDKFTSDTLTLDKQTPIDKDQNKKAEEILILEKTTQTAQTMKNSLVEGELIESSDAIKRIDTASQSLELNLNKTENDNIFVGELNLTKTAAKEVENIANQKVYGDAFSDLKQLRPRKIRDVSYVSSKESETSKALQQTNKTEPVVTVATIIENKNDKVKDIVHTVETIDTKCSSTNEVNERIVREQSMDCFVLESYRTKRNWRDAPKVKMNKNPDDITIEPSTDNNKQNSIKKIVDIVDIAAIEMSEKNLYDSENMKRATSTPESQSKIKASKQSKQSTKSEIENMSQIRNFMPPKDIVVEQLPKRLEIKPIEMHVIDIEDEIKLNIVHKEMPVATRPTKKETAAGRTHRNERPKVKAITKVEEKRKEKAAAPPITMVTVTAIDKKLIIPAGSKSVEVTGEEKEKAVAPRITAVTVATVDAPPTKSTEEIAKTEEKRKGMAVAPQITTVTVTAIDKKLIIPAEIKSVEATGEEKEKAVAPRITAMTVATVDEPPTKSTEEIAKTEEKRKGKVVAPQITTVATGDTIQTIPAEEIPAKAEEKQNDNAAADPLITTVTVTTIDEKLIIPAEIKSVAATGEEKEKAVAPQITTGTVATMDTPPTNPTEEIAKTEEKQKEVIVAPPLTVTAIDTTTTKPAEIKSVEATAEEEVAPFIPTTSRTMRSRRQTVVEPTISEPQLPDKKNATKTTKSKENKATKKGTPVKNEPAKVEPVNEMQVKVATVKETLLKEKLPKVVQVKEMPVREAKKLKVATKLMCSPSQINDLVDVKLSNADTRNEESVEMAPEIAITANEELTEEKSPIKERAVTEKTTNKKKLSPKSTKKSPNQAADTRPKPKVTTLKKADKVVDKADNVKTIASDPEMSKSQTKPTDQIDKKTDEMDCSFVEPRNQKQSDKSMEEDAKKSKKKSKKVKSCEKNIRCVKTSKLLKDTIDFDNSDDELLPWDPEKGFIQAKLSTIEKISELSPSPNTATPIDIPTGESRESEKKLVKSAPKPKKKRMSELAQIIADQLLESFKEVDQSRVDELKKIQDLSHSQSEAELISTSLSTTPIPKRKSKKLFENIEPKTNTKIDKISTKQKGDVSRKSVEPAESTVMSSLDSKPIDNSKQSQEDVTKEESVVEIDVVIKSKKVKRSSKKRSSKKDAKKKKNKKDTAADKSIDSQTVQSLPNTNAIKKKSSASSSITCIQSDSIVNKAFEKSLVTKSVVVSANQQTEKIQSLHVPSAINDMASSDCNGKSKTSSIFTEVLLSQKNPRTERLSDIIGLADKEALSRVPSIKNVAFPQWQSSIDKPTIMSAEKERNSSIQIETKLNFWSRSNPSSATGDKSDKSKIFGVVKNKARDLFSQISKKKLKKSIKTSIRSSSSSSSSSSCSSVSSSNAPKKPLLRPSILSCNNFRDTVTVKNATEAPSVNTARMEDIFESLRDSNRQDPIVKIDVNVSPSKLDARRSIKQEQNRNTIETNPKSPIESDMNIAKIAIALKKSNRKESQHQVEQNFNNTAIGVDNTVSPVEKPTKKSTIIEEEKKITATNQLTKIESSATPLFMSAFQNDDSQDTIISQIVSKIREKADRNDSDDELCLADVAKGLPNNTEIELPLTLSTALATANDQKNCNVENDTSALAPNDCKNPDGINATDIIEVQHAAKSVGKDTSYNASDDENTNTEMIDMDLEDNESVYTTFSQSTSITSGGGGGASGGRKKRKKKSILSSGRKSSRRSKELTFASPNVSYHCEICNKSFRNQHGLNNHKATITHISKLSEQEFLNAKEKQNENANGDESSGADQIKVIVASKEEKIATIEKSPSVETNAMPVKIVLPPETHDNIQSSVIRSSTVKINSTNCSPYVSPNHINSSAMESISSPEHTSRFNGTSKTAGSLTPSSVNARLTLSHEERLFYECCSMLKGSDRPAVGLAMPELLTKPVTPKCNEQPANIAQAAQSPRSHSSPRPALPKLEINQFSDISSDSNPAFSCPQVPSSSKTQKVFSLERSTPSKKAVTGREKDTPHTYGASQLHDTPDATASGKLAICYSSTIVRNYPDDSYSDMGDSFPSSQDASESENYAQTILERTNHFSDASSKMTHNTPQKGEGKHYMQASLPNENLDFRSVSNRSHLDSPLHSTSSQSSSLSRPRTKAALKGYENLKVSIPTTGLDLQHALERSPNSNGCKLAALADIALGNDVPFDLIRPCSTAATSEKSSPRSTKLPQKTARIPLRISPAKSPSKQSTRIVMSSDSTKLHSIELKSKSFEATFHVSPKSRKRTQPIGKKTGYKDRKKKTRAAGKMESVKLSPKVTNTTKPKDVYDFEESHDSVEDEIIPLTHTRPNKVELNSSIESKSSETPKKPTSDDQEDESSYSDRDDYYNFNSVSGSGTEDQDVPAEDDEISDRETTQSSRSTKTGNNSQNKCLIMGRIFKNAKKNSETASVESSRSNSKEKSIAKPIPKNDLDEIFDNLKNKNADVENQCQSSQQQQRQLASPPPLTPTPIEERPKMPKRKVERNNGPKSNTNDEQPEVTRTKSRKPREVANLEAEWGMSVEQIKGIIGVGMRKAQRRCTANRQNKLVETWSSDEYEEFHTTKDIIALIQEAEMKAQRAKARSAKINNEAKNTSAAGSGGSGGTGGGNDNIDDKSESADTVAKTSKTLNDSKKDKQKDRDGHRKVKIDSTEPEKAVDDETKTKVAGVGADTLKSKAKKTASEKFQSEGESDFDEHWNKKAKRAKIRNRRRTITSREDLIEKKVKSKSKEKLTRKQEVVPKQKQPFQSTTAMCEKEKKKSHSIKEVESTTSTTKSNNKSMKDGKPMPRRKRMASEMLYYWSSSSDEEFGRIEANSENEDEDNSENHLEQHGWIVGDSHKKLVTLLAHAKGKKIEDCGVKESVNKRK